MRKFVNVCLLTMTLTTSLLFITSCGNDDKDESKTNNGTNALVGEWICLYEDGYDTYTFNFDGSGIGTENAYGGGSGTWFFNYTYNETTQQLYMQDYSNKEDVTTATVIIHEDKNSFTYIDSDGDSWKFTRQK